MTTHASTPTPDRWSRIEEVFHALLELPRDARDAELGRLGESDAELVEEVRSLLAAHEGTGLLDAVSRERTPSPPPQWVGPYRVLRELGHGGMGTVFLAERTGEGFRQHVALKLIRADYADPRLEAALASERRILARLEHPSIARFIDGGTTPSGQPYFAMEHVAGTPLLRFCEERGLSKRKRLALFARICEGVQYAHQQLVVHRDIKPGNILVTDDGRPVLLDFGVAKLLDDSTPPDGSGATANWVTPAYAAPEQLLHRPVTTRTDVYALGVILYEMLLGRLPYAEGDGSLAAMVRAVCETPAITPSDAARSAGNARLARTLSGDLDTILCKALVKEPDRRYGSVEQLADDVRRYLDGRPVLARPDTPAYRARKFIQRNRVLMLAASVVTLTLVAGIAATTWQARLAREERDRAREALAQSEDVTSFLLNLFESSDPRRTAGDTVTARAILQRGLSRVEELSGQPVVQARLLDALGRVLASLGQYERAQQLVERGLSLRATALAGNDPDIAAGHRRLAEILRERGAYAQAETSLVSALRIHRSEPGRDLQVAETLYDLAFLMPYLGRMSTSESLYVESYRIRERLLGPDDPATLQGRLAVALRRRLHDPVGAEQEMRETLEARRRVLGANHPDVVLTMLHLADAVGRRPGGVDEADSLYASANEIQRGNVGERDLSLIHGLAGQAEMATRRGDHRRAESFHRRAVEIRRAILGSEHPAVLLSEDAVATSLARQGRFAEAEALKRSVLAGLRRAYGERHNNIAGALGGLADMMAWKGDLEQAERYARETLAIREAILAPEHNTIAISRIGLARILVRRGELEEAREQARRAREVLAKSMSDDDEWMVAAAEVLTQTAVARGR